MNWVEFQKQLVEALAVYTSSEIKDETSLWEFVRYCTEKMRLEMEKKMKDEYEEPKDEEPEIEEEIEEED